MAGKTSALALITLAYIACIAAGAAVLYGLHLPALWDTLVADVVATIVIFAFSRVYRNSSFYDAYWTVIPPLLLFYWWYRSTEVEQLRVGLIPSVVMLWALRLTANWGYAFPGLHHADCPYRMFITRACRFATPPSLSAALFTPTLTV